MAGQAVQRPMRNRNSEESEYESLEESEKGSLWSQETQPLEGDLKTLAADIWPAAAALAVSAGCATLLFPFFTFVVSSGWLKSLLPQVCI